MRARTILVFLAVGLAASIPLYSQETASLPTLSAAEAKDHIGKKAKVCGRVASARYLDYVAAQPTLLNLDKPYPTQVFTVMIPGWDREKFSTPEAGKPEAGAPEVKYKGKTICVTGKITSYRGVPQIVAEEPEQIEVQPEEPPAAAKPKPGTSLTLSGKLTAEGVECPAFRAEDNTLYTLTGDLKGFKAGDRVCLEGTVVEASICMQGTTLKLTSIRKCK